MCVCVCVCVFEMKYQLRFSVNCKQISSSSIAVYKCFFVLFIFPDLTSLYMIYKCEKRVKRGMKQCVCACVCVCCVCVCVCV